MTGRSRRWGRHLAGLSLLLLVLAPGAASAATRADGIAHPATAVAAHAVDVATVPAAPRLQGGHALTRSSASTPPAVVAAAVALLGALGCSLARIAQARRPAVAAARSRRERAPPSHA